MTDIVLYEYIYNKRWIINYSWQQISDSLQLGLNRNSMQKKFSRLAKKVKQPYKPEETEKVKLSTKKVKLSKDKVKLDDFTSIGTIDSSSLTIDEIESTKYGDVKPTNYISPLSNDDWIAHYIPFMVWVLPYLTELREMLWNEKDLLVLLPRNHGKSDTVTALFVRWILEVRTPILVLCASNSLAKDIFLMVEDLLTDPLIRLDYGDVLNNANKGEQKMYFVPSIKYRYRDAMFRAATQQTKVKGSHPTWIHFDDVIDGEYINVSSNSMVERWYDRSIVPMRRHTLDDPTRITGTVTRQGVKDFYQFLIDERGYKILHKEALWKDEDGNWQTLNCPNFPLEVLLEYKERDPIGFQEQMQNNPVPLEGIYFDADDLLEYNPEDVDLSNADWYMAVDPADGMGSTADFWAGLVCAIKDGELYIHDGVIKRNLRHSKQMEIIHDFNDKYHLLTIWIEKVMTQVILHQRMDYLNNVRPYTVTNKSKMQRINAIPLDKRIIHINRQSQPYIEMMIQVRSYDQKPSTDSKKDDGLDSLSMIIYKVGRFLKGGNKVNWSKVKLRVSGRT